MSSRAVLAPLGVNPAAFSELIWALHRGGEPVDEAMALLQDEEALAFWLGEMVGYALPQLEAETGRLDVGWQVLVGEEAFAETFWDMLKRLQERHEEVVVSLSGGRWRGSAALTSGIFQLLARPRDRLVDVRVSRVAEGGTGFFFPSQPDQELVGVHAMAGRSFQAQRVEIRLEPVPVPKLRVLLPTVPESFEVAVARVQEALDANAPAQIRVDLAGRRVLVGDKALRLSPNAFALYACLALEGPTGSWDTDALRPFLVGRALPVSGVLDEVRRGAGQDLDALQRLSQNWSRMRRSVEQQVLAAGLPRALVPRFRTTARGSVWSLPDKLVVG